jgi:CIC family chloride channel protein
MEGQEPPVRPQRSFLAALLQQSPLDLPILGRTLWHAAVVGLAAGVCGVIFFGALEYVQLYVLETLTGYQPLRAHGETFVHAAPGSDFRPWLVALLPAAGALLGGILTARLAPEAQGGGGDALIHAFHREGSSIRPRVIWVKGLASILTLGTGGSGGREGPTMQIGGALGSAVASLLRVGPRERRILLVAGVAAGMSAVFRTPLGAALLAVEILYRDDFESDALIPALLASVLAYSVCISVFGETTLYATADRYPFRPAHLPLYGLLALLVALLAAGFVGLLRAVQRLTVRLPVPLWARPGLGGLALGLFAAPAIYFVGHHVGVPGQGLGLLGGGYGAGQIAITGSPLLSAGWAGVELLLLLCVGKMIASALTIGSGGSAGDFAPSLVIGGLFGGAFGRVAQIVTGDPTLDPGAFALVGMGTFYGGIAHVPLSSTIMVCELAGSYDLLVPLMLAEGIAFVALRKVSLYPAQVPSKRESPVHREAMVLDVLKTVKVRDVIVQGRPFVRFDQRTPSSEMIQVASDATWQDVFPVLGESGSLVGMVTSDNLRILASEIAGQPLTIAADVMQPPVTVRSDADLRDASQVLVEHGLREAPVLDAEGRIIGFLDEADVAKAYLSRTSGASAGG